MGNYILFDKDRYAYFVIVTLHWNWKWNSVVFPTLHISHGTTIRRSDLEVADIQTMIANYNQM